MGTFTITKSELNNQYTFRNEDVVVVGGYSINVQTSTLQRVSGTINHVGQEEGEDGDYIGDFNGHPENGEMVYSLPQMSRRISNLVWDAIDGIESNITGANPNTTEE